MAMAARAHPDRSARAFPKGMSALGMAALWGGALVGVGAMLGMPGWLAGAMLAACVAVGTAALVRGADRARARLEDAERGQVRAVWSLIGGAASEPAPTDASGLASLIEEERRALRAQVEELRRILDAMETATLAVDPAGVVVHANAAAVGLLGAGSGTPAGRSVDDLFTQPELVAMAAAARRGTGRRAWVKVPRQGGLVVLDVAATPLTRAGRAGGDAGRPTRHPVVVTLRDVTELATAAQLKTDFVANASHELRTPLASIRAAVETIESMDDDPEARARFLRTIATSVARLEDLCGHLLDLSRVEAAETPTEKRPVRLEQLAAELTDLFLPVCTERRLTLAFEIEPAAAVVESDPRLLHVILRNLIENSTKFAYEGTKIRVTASGGEEDGRTLRIEVSDEGVGIPIALQGRIFERFFQVDPSRATSAGVKRGTGLGLAIVKHAVRALGGTITVRSVWKQGTTVSVELPRAIGGGVVGEDEGAGERVTT